MRTIVDANGQVLGNDGYNQTIRVEDTETQVVVKLRPEAISYNQTIRVEDTETHSWWKGAEGAKGLQPNDPSRGY